MARRTDHPEEGEEGHERSPRPAASFGRGGVPGELLSRIQEAHDINDVVSVLALLSDIARQRKRSGHADVRALQDVSSCLTQVRLVLKDMEREEVLAKGASRTIADRYVEVEHAVRAIAADLQSAFHNGTP